MENGAHALHMAFAIFVFVLAISLAFATFSQAREVSDIVLYYNDKTNFDEYVESMSGSYRIVGLDVIVPLIRNYIHENENYSVVVDLGSEKIIFDINEQNNQGIFGHTELLDYCETNLKRIIKNYQGRLFEEIFSEYVQVGGVKEFADGETLEKINTLTKVKITYKLK